MVVQRDPLIRTTEQMATLALDAEDYPAALSAANHLHAYGEVYLKDAVGEEAFDLSLGVHRRFGTVIYDKFGGRDVFLRHSGAWVFKDIATAVGNGDRPREYTLIRSIPHVTALNGTLGPEAKQLFDPFALGSIE
jgi:hypothetical protein